MAFGFANEDQDMLERLTHETGGHVEYPLNSLYKDVSGYLSNPPDDGNYALTVGTGGYAARDLQRDYQGGWRDRRRDHDAVHAPLPCRTSIPRRSRRFSARSRWIFRGCPT